MEKLKPNNVWALGVVRTSLSGPKFQIMLDHMSCHGHAWMVSCFFNQIMSCHVMSYIMSCCLGFKLVHVMFSKSLNMLMVVHACYLFVNSSSCSYRSGPQSKMLLCPL